MRKLFSLLTPVAFWIILSWLTPVAVMAHDDEDTRDGVFMIEDAASVPEAVQAIRTTLEDQGFTLAAVIDHAANAASVGLELRPTVLIIFSDPKTETRLIRRSQTVAIDLPQKFLVWEDEMGRIRLAFNSPGYLSERHDIEARDRLLRHLDKVLGQFGPLDNGLVTIDSSQSVEDTVASLQAALQSAGFRLPLFIDFTAQARGKKLRPTQLVVAGNPNVGTQLMQNQQSIGLDLPQKFLVWEDSGGQVRITYNDPLFIAKRHNIQGLEALLGNITNALANFAAAGANP
jgi:uncharacterized protein (DUF302 family)